VKLAFVHLHVCEVASLEVRPHKPAVRYLRVCVRVCVCVCVCVCVVCGVCVCVCVWCVCVCVRTHTHTHTHKLLPCIHTRTRTRTYKKIEILRVMSEIVQCLGREFNCFRSSGRMLGGGGGGVCKHTYMISIYISTYVN
jgi:hypothetical protein